MKEPVLSDRVMTMLVSSEYALLISRSASGRLSYIVDIASLHTREELVCKPGLGRGTVRQIETWLGFHGRRLRLSSESIDSVICTFDFRKRSRRRSRGMSETMTRWVESRGRNGTQMYLTRTPPVVVVSDEKRVRGTFFEYLDKANLQLGATVAKSLKPMLLVQDRPKGMRRTDVV